MKKSGFKNKQRKPMKRSGFKTSKGFMEIHKAKTGFLEGVPIAVFKTNLKRTPFKQKPQKPLRRTKLRLVGHSSTTELKNEIQALLRQIAIRRDGGCILRNYKSEITPRYQDCGGYRKDGELILQAEHLHTRSNLSTFADTRLIVCLCKRHHGYYKPQHSDEYYEIVKKHIGKERADLLKRVKEDRGVHRGIDLKMELLNLKKELLKLGPEELKINN